MMQLQRYIRKPTKLTDSLITGCYWVLFTRSYNSSTTQLHAMAVCWAIQNLIIFSFFRLNLLRNDL